MREEKAGATTLPEIREDHDWKDAFGFASGANAQGDAADIRTAAPGDDVSLDPFGIDDVAEVFAAVEGENDGPDWLAWGKLKDGRYFSLRAGCDYTGWDCQAGGHAEVASTKDAILAQGFDAEERERLGLA